MVQEEKKFISNAPPPPHTLSVDNSVRSVVLNVSMGIDHFGRKPHGYEVVGKEKEGKQNVNEVVVFPALSVLYLGKQG